LTFLVSLNQRTGIFVLSEKSRNIGNKNEQEEDREWGSIDGFLRHFDLAQWGASSERRLIFAPLKFVRIAGSLSCVDISTPKGHAAGLQILRCRAYSLGVTKKPA